MLFRSCGADHAIWDEDAGEEAKGIEWLSDSSVFGPHVRFVHRIASGRAKVSDLNAGSDGKRQATCRRVGGQTFARKPEARWQNGPSEPPMHLN